MQFARILLFLFAALVSAVAIPNPPVQGGGSDSKCSSTQFSACCNPVSGGQTNIGGGILGGLLQGLTLIDALSGNSLQCTSIGSGGACQSKAYCCDNHSGSSVVSVSCVSIL